MSLILNIDTTTKICSVAIAKEGNLLAKVEAESDQFIHSEKLHLFIEQCLNEACIKSTELEAIAVSKGPGSYTGLRIGVSAAKGLCYALNIPLISIDTLEALSKKAIETINDKAILIPMLDARRMEVYCCVFDDLLNLIKPIQASIIEEDSFAEFGGKKVCYFGEGAEKCVEVLNDEFNFLPNLKTSAVNMIPLSLNKFAKNDFEDLAYFEPFYLKDFVAGKPKKLL